jgi:hypothetical protein
MLLLVGAIKADSFLHVLGGSDQLRERAPGGWPDDPGEVLGRRAIHPHAPQGVLIRADDPWSGIDDGAVKINKDGEHGGSWFKSKGYSALHLMRV